MTAPAQFESRAAVMRRAIEIARRGEGFVEPNPMVGCVIVDADLRFIAEGLHERVGAAHAEVNALQAAGTQARGATLFVTLEPCNHQGRTPPCTEAVLAAGISAVEIAVADPAPHTDSAGIERLAAAGLTVHTGLLADEGRRLIAPFRKVMTRGLPWVIAKWAMTLDGKIASHSGHSQWISGAESRAVVHRIRGRVDAVVVGSGTVVADDPQLTARPPGPRSALRAVMDRRGRLPAGSKLALTANDVPVLMFTSDTIDSGHAAKLAAGGVEVLTLASVEPLAVLEEFGRRGCTNVLVEGGGQVLGAFFDAGLIDEAHVFIAPRLVGGAAAASPLAGQGLDAIPQSLSLVDPVIRSCGSDVYVSGRLHDR